MNEAEQIIFEIIGGHPLYAFIQNILKIETLRAIRDIFNPKLINEYDNNKKQIENECGEECIEFLEECNIISKSINNKTDIKQNKNDCLIACFSSKLQLSYPIDDLSLLKNIGDQLKENNKYDEKLIIEYYKKEDFKVLKRVITSVKNHFKNQKYSVEQINFIRELLSLFKEKQKIINLQQIVKNLQNKIENYNNKNPNKLINLSFALRNLIVLSDSDRDKLLDGIKQVDSNNSNEDLDLIDILKDELNIMQRQEFSELNRIIKDYDKIISDKDFIERCIDYLLNDNKKMLKDEESDANNKLRTLVINSCYEVTFNDIKNAPAIVIPTLLAQMDNIIKRVWNILNLSGFVPEPANSTKSDIDKFIDIGFYKENIIYNFKNIDIPVMHKFYFYYIIDKQIFTNNINKSNTLVRNDILHGSNCFYNTEENLIKSWLALSLLVDMYKEINEKYGKETNN